MRSPPVAIPGVQIRRQREIRHALISELNLKFRRSGGAIRDIPMYLVVAGLCWFEDQNLSLDFGFWSSERVLSGLAIAIIFFKPHMSYLVVHRARGIRVVVRRERGDNDVPGNTTGIIRRRVWEYFVSDSDVGYTTANADHKGAIHYTNNTVTTPDSMHIVGVSVAVCSGGIICHPRTIGRTASVC